jgi:hypothetical protein
MPRISKKQRFQILASLPFLKKLLWDAKTAMYNATRVKMGGYLKNTQRKTLPKRIAVN